MNHIEINSENPAQAKGMKAVLQLLREKPQTWGIPLSLLALLGLISKIFTISPAIVPDEYIYAKFSRLLPMAEASIPDYLFYWVFGATKSCGPNFYTCGKAINLLFFVGIAVLVYLIARRLVSEWQAWLVALLTLVSPLGYYASFFMPEMMFYFSCLVVVYAMLFLKPESTYLHYVGLGALLGLAALTKPHALFLGAPIVLLAFYLGEKNPKKESFATSGVKVAAAALSSVIVKFALGFVFAGPNGISLFGNSYTGTLTSIASSSVSNEETVQSAEPVIAQNAGVDYLGIFVQQIGAHSMATVLLNLAALCVGFVAFKSAKNESQKQLFVTVLAIAITGILTIAFFTSIVSGSGADHSDRIMVRYYDYLLPLSLILLATSSHLMKNKKVPNRQLLLPGALILIAIFSMTKKLEPFKPNFYDGTSLDGFMNWTFLGWLAIILTVLLVALIARGSKLQTAVTFALVMPLITLGSFNAAAESLGPSSVIDRFDRAAQFTKNYLLDNEFEQLTVVSYESYPLSRALLQLDNAKVDFRLIERGQTLDAKSLEPNKEWVLLIGDSFVNMKGCLRQQGNGYQLIKLCRTSKEFYFNQEITNDSLVSKLEGVGSPENWGAWTIGKKSTVTLREALPANSKVTVTLAAAAFADDQEYVATLGDSSIKFSLDTEAIDASFEFQNSTPASQLIFEVAKPKAAKDSGNSQDSRLVGLKLFKVALVK